MKMKTYLHKDLCANVYSGFIYQPNTGKWINKMRYVHVHDSYLAVKKKNEVLM